jgi:hypothetical protein
VLALTGVDGGRTDGRGSVDPELLDEELALQLHLAMNGSQRISRSGNLAGSGSAEQDKGKKYVVGGRKGKGEQEICVTNMMAQLDDEFEHACSKVSRRVRTSEPLVTVVLALESSNPAEKSMEAKRKDLPETKLQDDLVGRYKKKYYCKRNSDKQAKVENVVCVTKHDGKEKDIDGDHGSNGTTAVK